jgi:hypothetical protein
MASQEDTAVIRWRDWPLVDQRRWSWVVPAGVLAMGATVWYVGGGWLGSLAAMAGLVATSWQFFLPVDFELDSLGIRRKALGRVQIVPWRAVRAYQPRPTGVVLYQCHEPTKLDVLRSLFVPYPADEDEMLCAMREHLSHAVELPQ